MIFNIILILVTTLYFLCELCNCVILILSFLIIALYCFSLILLIESVCNQDLFIYSSVSIFLFNNGTSFVYFSCSRNIRLVVFSCSGVIVMVDVVCEKLYVGRSIIRHNNSFLIFIRLSYFYYFNC